MKRWVHRLFVREDWIREAGREAFRSFAREMEGLPAVENPEALEYEDDFKLVDPVSGDETPSFA